MYKHEMTEDDHSDFLEVLNALPDRSCLQDMLTHYTTNR